MKDVGQPVARPEGFFGRQNIVRRIYSRIGAERPQSVAVIGGRQVGKSSLLAFLADPSVQKANLPDPARYVFVSLPGRADPALDAAGFLALLCERLGVDRRPGETEYNRLQRRVEELHRRGVNLVCFFDDFHFVTQNNNFPLEFFSFLRSLANNFNLAYVTTSYLELQKLCVAKDIQESPFFNIFTNIALGLLAPEEAGALLVSLTGWPPGDARRIAEWAGPLPYIMKLTAAACPDGPPPDGRLEKVLLPLLKEYFSSILAILPREALKPLKDLVKGKEADPRDAHYLKPLIRHHFLIEGGEPRSGASSDQRVGDSDASIGFFSEAFKHFVQKFASPDLLKGEGYTM